jgi:hypothetical protein
MKYFSIRALFDHWSRLRGAPLVPECGEVDNILEDKTNRGATAGPGASPNQLAAVLMVQRAAKRSFDIIVATLGLNLLSPILLISSLAIMLDSRGPIVRTHLRHGCGNKTFRVLKFRSTTGENIDRNIQESVRNSRLTRAVTSYVHPASMEFRSLSTCSAVRYRLLDPAHTPRFPAACLRSRPQGFRVATLSRGLLAGHKLMATGMRAVPLR